METVDKIFEAIKQILQEKSVLVIENKKLCHVIDKIDNHELKIFVQSDGRMVTNEFKVSMKELHDALK